MLPFPKDELRRNWRSIGPEVPNNHHGPEGKPDGRQNSQGISASPDSAPSGIQADCDMIGRHDGSDQFKNIATA